MAMNEAPPSFNSYREAIHAFLQERLNAKLEKLKTDEDGKREDVIAQHQPTVWLEDAARRVQQIQAVTHSLKPIHPDARGTNLYVEPTTLPPLAELGSHALGGRRRPWWWATIRPSWVGAPMASPSSGPRWSGRR